MSKKIRIFAALLLGISSIFFANSCKKEVIEPEFPEKEIVLTLKAGESTDISFNANLDWTLRVSGEGAGSFFGIMDEGLLETKISGQAGPQVVTVGFTDDLEFDVDRECIVTLEMGGKSKDIAKLTKLRGDRTLEVYAAVVDDFDFKKTGGNYVYQDSPDAALSFITFPGSTEYSLPIKVVSNFNWILKTGSEFVTASVSEATGEATETLLTLKCDASLAAGSQINIEFLSSNAEGAASYPVSVTIPPFGNRMEIDCQSTLYFNQEGLLKMPTGSFSETPAICYVLAAKGAIVRALEWNAAQGWYELSYAAWVKSEMNFNEEGEYIQNVTAKLGVEPNTAEERYADIMILPASLASMSAEDLCNASGDAIKDEYKPYLAGRLTQEGKKADFVALDPDADNYKASLEKNAAGTDWLKGEFGTDEIYTLTYSDQYSEAALVFQQAVSVEILDYDLQKVSESALETFWLEINTFAAGKKARVYMYPEAYVSKEGEKPESFVVLKDASNNALAVLDCRYDASSSSEGGEMFSITSGTGTITKLTSGDYYDGICGNFSVTEVYDITVSSAATILKSATAPSAFNIYNMELSLIKDGSLSIEGYTANEFYLFVGETITEKTSWIVVGKDANSVNYAAFIYTYDPDATGSSELVSFAYPDNVKNATISKYSGSLLSQIKGEHYGVDENVIYELKYTGEPQMALINVPGAPYGDAAWGNFDENTGGNIPGYWLTYEMEGSKQMYVNMTETGKSDWFVWMDMATYKPILVLVCTAEAN